MLDPTRELSVLTTQVISRQEAQEQVEETISMSAGF